MIKLDNILWVNSKSFDNKIFIYTQSLLTIKWNAVHNNNDNDFNIYARWSKMILNKKQYNLVSQSAKIYIYKLTLPLTWKFRILLKQLRVIMILMIYVSSQEIEFLDWKWVDRSYEKNLDLRWRLRMYTYTAYTSFIIDYLWMNIKL